MCDLPHTTGFTLTCTLCAGQILRLHLDVLKKRISNVTARNLELLANGTVVKEWTKPEQVQRADLVTEKPKIPWFRLINPGDDNGGQGKTAGRVWRAHKLHEFIAECLGESLFAIRHMHMQFGGH